MAPLKAHSTPVSVSPTFMLETSIAAIVVSSGRGFKGIGCNMEELWGGKASVMSSEVSLGGS